jgi:hypothetical protein
MLCLKIGDSAVYPPDRGAAGNVPLILPCDEVEGVLLHNPLRQLFEICGSAAPLNVWKLPCIYECL